jgi:hypothetical protein
MPAATALIGDCRARHNDGRNANIEAVRLGIEGARTMRDASAVAVHIGGSSAVPM